MKKNTSPSFFFREIDTWYSPSSVFSALQASDTTPQNHHLFFSGETENPEISGRYSFIALENTVDTTHNICGKDSLFWEDIKADFLKISGVYTEDKNLSNWSFPFCGGLTGVFSYDFVRLFENIPDNTEMNDQLPVASLLMCYQFVAFDHQKKQCFIAGWFENEKAANIFFQKRERKIKNAPDQSDDTPEIFLKNNGFTPEISRESYRKNFEVCQNEIAQGNSFQINFSQKFLAKTPSSAWDIFLNATQKNSAQMMYFHDQYNKDFSVISCSPERLFSCDRNQKIFTQPIAGTRPRGKNTAEEIELEHELTSSLKELSEHSMIVDLLRNDFGKVSAFGSVQVEKFMRVEKYATVMHLVSDISGTIAPEKNIFDVFESLFPGGTITGTPKTETMKILAREEISSRNFYCGSAGYFSFCGSADWNILIRTIEKEGEKISGRAGGGLVHGANADHEYEESLHKFSGIQKIFE